MPPGDAGEADNADEGADAGGADLAFDHAVQAGDEADPGYTLLLLHGTGADERDLLPLGRSLAPGKPRLSPLGKVRERGMPRWFARHDEGVFDEASIRERAAELAAFLPEAARAHDLPDRFVAVGFSNGANIAASLLLLHPEALRGAVLLRAMTPLEPDELPDLAGVPVYIASGAHDELVPRGDAENLASLLEEAGADVTHRFAEAGHQLARDEVAAVREWLEERDDRLRKPR